MPSNALQPASLEILSGFSGLDQMRRSRRGGDQSVGWGVVGRAGLEAVNNVLSHIGNSARS
jgi:hypothetical protein